MFFLYERIFLLAKSNGIQQKELAKMIGVQPSAISDWKSGRIRPSVEDICKLADIFDVETDYLLGRTDIKDPVYILNKKQPPPNQKAVEFLQATLIENDLANDDGELTDNAIQAISEFLSSNANTLKKLIDKG